MKRDIVRYDLDRCYRLGEYNEAIAYAKRNIEIKGVREEAEELEREKAIYIKDVESITNPVREEEEKKYSVWVSYAKAGNICKWISIGSLICSFIHIFFSNVFFEVVGRVSFYFLMLIALPAFVITEIAVMICDKSYGKYTNKIKERVIARNNSFASQSRAYYNRIDELYLSSLDPVLRETVLMRREQEEHNKKMELYEQERQRQEFEKYKEQKRMREVQEKLLAIETERERRYNQR